MAEVWPFSPIGRSALAVVSRALSVGSRPVLVLVVLRSRWFRLLFSSVRVRCLYFLVVRDRFFDVLDRRILLWRAAI